MSKDLSSENCRTQDECIAADTIVFGKIYTVNSRRPWVEAVAIRGNKITAVGTHHEMECLRGEGTRTIDAGNRLVLPGLVDTHLHLGMEPSRSLYFGFRATSVDETLRAVKEQAKAKPEDNLLLAWALLSDGAENITKGQLDSVVADRPLMIFDGHDVFANSKALELANITCNTPDPDGGKIYRDPDTGELTGRLKEAAGRMAISCLAPNPTREVSLKAFHEAFVTANQMGLVRLHSVGWDTRNLELFEELRNQGRLTVRLLVATIAEPPALGLAYIERMEGLRQRYNDDWIDANAVKLFEDGLIETHTAAMLEPYADDGSKVSNLYWPADEFRRAVVEMNRRGFPVLVHATGDRSAKETLDAFEAARSINGRPETILRIEHAEQVQPVDVPRIAELKVMVSAHPLFLEANWGKQETCVGPDRMAQAYQWQSILTCRGRLVFGSDYPAYTMNPWEGIQTLVTRQQMPQQRLTVAQAIEGYTLGAAYAGGRSGTEGSLEVGKLADLIVVSQNIFEVEQHQIGKTEALLTMVGGDVVYNRSGKTGSESIFD
jgi:predicted amidohydrolase YtcJ